MKHTFPAGKCYAAVRSFIKQFIFYHLAENIFDGNRSTADFASAGGAIHARGTANLEAEKLFNISIQPEKEIVMIVVKKEIKNDVLHALYKSVGLDTPGQGIAFYLPVTEVVGIKD